MVYFNEASEKLCFVAKFCDCSRIKGFPMPQHMFSWRSQRRIGAILVVFTFFGIFGAVSYWRFKALPTCSDNIKNQDELAVDCGGSCGAAGVRREHRLGSVHSGDVETGEHRAHHRRRQPHATLADQVNARHHRWTINPPSIFPEPTFR